MSPLVVVVSAGLPPKTLKELIDYAKANPGALNFASAGQGSIGQLVGFWVQSETGTKMAEVPYKGVNAEIPDLIAGQVQVGYIVSQVITGPVLGDKRLPGLPDVPTGAEAGLPGVEAIVWNGIFAPGGTPRPVIDVLHRELVKAYNAPEIKAQVEAAGSTIVADTPDEFAAFIRAETAKWGKVGRAAGVKPQQ
jgi:tripartite-type tricarboxylate transporter receptor subunit TctC